jgi:hypothetical protein
MRRPLDTLFVGVLALALVATAALAIGGAGAGEPVGSAGAAGWRALLGDRPAPLLGQRQIVVLKAASLADRVVRAGGSASEEQMRAWTTVARRKQDETLARLAFKGAPITPELTYLRVLNGFSASLDARTAALVERDPGVAGVFPVRAAYPAAVGDTVAGLAGGRVAGISLPGFDGTGITVALLDTGVDPTHPFIRGSLLDGIDIVDPGGDATARQHPTIADRQERHGTELAGLIVGALGEAGIAGVAPGASLLPVRVAGWQPDATGDVAVYARTDQLVAGLEAAVDPDGNGDAHDAARVAVLGLAEPFAAFATGPLAQASEGALSLNTLVVAPAGNEGPAGPSFGSVGGPGGAPGALTVAAVDTREQSRSVSVLLRSGLRVLLSGEQPLGGAFEPHQPVSVRVVVVPAKRVEAAGGPRGISAYFGEQGFSLVAGSAALLPRGATSPEGAREAAAAGARAILVDGPLPAGALTLDGSVSVPILGLPTAVARTIRDLRRAGEDVVVSVSEPRLGANAGDAAAAAFSSRGLAFDGGVKPELGAPGVGLATSVPGRVAGGGARYGVVSGSSAAAAVAGGAAALLAQARPDLDGAALKAALIGAAAALPGTTGSTGAGMIDPDAAAAVEVVALPGTAGLPRTDAEGEASMALTLRSVSSRTLDTVLSVDRVGGGTEVEVTPSLVRLRPGKTVDVTLTVRPAGAVEGPAALGGSVRIRPVGAAWTRVPWALALPVEDRPVLRNVRLSRPALTADDDSPLILSLVAGRVDGTAARPQVLAIDLLDVELLRDGRLLGRLARLRNLLPGRYAFGLTGRDPAGERLSAGTYELRVVARPVAGAEDETTVDFTIR